MLSNANLPFTDPLWSPDSEGFVVKKENDASECARLPWKMLQSEREKNARDSPANLARMPGFHSHPLSSREINFP